ncbi:unnamed protein product, partial [marine sediment metagenome]
MVMEKVPEYYFNITYFEKHAVLRRLMPDDVEY